MYVCMYIYIYIYTYTSLPAQPDVRPQDLGFRLSYDDTVGELAAEAPPSPAASDSRTDAYLGATCMHLGAVLCSCVGVRRDM